MNDPTTINIQLPSPYQLIKKLGSGSFGHVYLVTDTQTQQQCVIKQLYLMSQQANFVEKATKLFKQEAEILNKLNHPQVPKLLNYFEQEGQLYLVQEYVEGHTLRQELIVGQPWPEENVIKLLQECLSILHDIHAQGIIHRDIKPDNLIRNQHTHKLVLIDFGAVKQFNLDQSRIIDRTSAIGTPWYMPKEQFEGKPNKNSDIYALGIIAIQALLGKNPGDLDKNEEGEIDFSNCAFVNPAFANILKKMTLDNYLKRYHSTEDVIKDINIYQQRSIANNTFASVSSPEYNQQNVGINLKKPPLNQEQNDDNFSQLEPSTQTSSSTKQSNAITDWLKSPLGSTFTTAMTVGLVATVGVYIMNQMDIKRSEKEKERFIQSLKNQYEQQAYVPCYESAEEKLQEENHTIPTRTLVQYIGVCRFEAAKQKAKILNYAEALEILTSIPDNYEYYSQVNIHQENWSKEIVAKARFLYQEEGNLAAASKEIDAIPSSPIREAALINLSEWQREYERNTAIINQANRDLEYEYCTAAIETASKIYGSNYWLLEGKKILDKAQKCLEDQFENPPSQPNPPPNQPNPPPSQPNPPPSQPNPPQPNNEDNVIQVCPGPLCPE